MPLVFSVLFCPGALLNRGLRPTRRVYVISNGVRHLAESGTDSHQEAD